MSSLTLTQLIRRGESLNVDHPGFLLDASELSQAINELVLGDPVHLASVRQALMDTAARTGCDLIVGASSPATSIVQGLSDTGAEPTRALLFELVRVTGSTLALGLAELRHIDVVPAVLVDLNPSTTAADVVAVSTGTQ